MEYEISIKDLNENNVAIEKIGYITDGGKKYSIPDSKFRTGYTNCAQDRERLAIEFPVQWEAVKVIWGETPTIDLNAVADGIQNN